MYLLDACSACAMNSAPPLQTSFGQALLSPMVWWLLGDFALSDQVPFLAVTDGCPSILSPICKIERMSLP